MAATADVVTDTSTSEKTVTSAKVGDMDVDSEEKKMEDNSSSESDAMEDIPPQFLCPITREIMAEPMITMAGHTYDKFAIEEWFASHNTDPLTSVAMPTKLLIPNHALRTQINTYIEKHSLKVAHQYTGPFKPLLQLLRIHAHELKSLTVSCNLLQRRTQDFSTEQSIHVLTTFTQQWNKYSKQIEDNWTYILANVLFIKDLIQSYQNDKLPHFIRQSNSDNKPNPVKLDNSIVVLSAHIYPPLITIKTGLRTIAGIQSNIDYTIRQFFAHTRINAFTSELQQMLNSTESLEDDITTLGVIFGAIVGGNAGGTTGAAVGSAGGPVGTFAGAAIGFYLGALAGATPPTLYAVYREKTRKDDPNLDHFWRLVHFGFQKFSGWVAKEKEEFSKYDTTVNEWITIVVDTSDANRDKPTIFGDDMLETWLYELTRLIPVLEECLMKP